MTKYDISGSEVVISTETENERFLQISTAKLVQQAGERFDKWYAGQYNCDSLYKNSDDIINEALNPIVQIGVKIINDQGVYSLDEKMFMDKYLKGVCDSFYEVVEAMMDKVDEIEGQKNMERANRQARKANRGRVVGGGFGLGGAIKGMATAGLMNATTGMAHSLGNAVGNIGSSIAASANKGAVFREVKAPLRAELIRSAKLVVDGIRKALEKEARIKCKCVTAAEIERATAILNNYKQNRIPEEHKKSEIIKALQLNPFDLAIYCAIWEGYGDKNGSLRKMSSYFDVGLETHIKEIAQDYCNNLCANLCNEYENAWNKRYTGIQSEEKFKHALEDMLKYCAEHDILESTIPAIGRCKEILAAIDRDLRIYRGVAYDTRELAENVRRDYENFYRSIAGKNIFDSNTYEYASSAEYSTGAFRNNLKNIFDEECQLRTPEKVYENMFHIVNKTLKTNEQWAEIPGYMASLREKESMIRGITGMQSDETLLIFFDKSSNGKAGIAITNYYFRIFSKGILSNENRAYPIENVKKIDCLKKNEYILTQYVKTASEQEAVKFNLKHQNLTAEQQIAIAEMMSELAILVNNLFPEDRRGLYRIVNGVIRCTCGMRLLAGERLCPSCQRLLTDHGEFVETRICPNCKNHIPTGKKFCFLCGFKLIAEETTKQTEQAEYTACPGCGRQVTKGQKFCTQCGAKILYGKVNEVNTDE